MSQGMSLRPIKQKILVRKCLAAKPVRIDGTTTFMIGAVAVSQWYGQTSRWAEVIDVADDCRLFTRAAIGKFVLLPEWNPQKMTRVGTRLEDGVEVEEFIVKESLFTDQNGAAPMTAG